MYIFYHCNMYLSVSATYAYYTYVVKRHNLVKVLGEWKLCMKSYLAKLLCEYLDLK